MSNKKQNGSNLDEIIEKTFAHIKDIVDANTVVGTTIKLTDKTFVIPVSKISVGLISGGGILPKSKREPFSAGSGTGFNIVPIGFVAISDGIFSFLPVNTDNFSKTIVDGLFKVYEVLTKPKGETDDKEI